MSTIYKLTDQEMQTHNGFQWKLNEQTPELPAGGELCSSSFYHAYTSPLLAILLNPVHGRFKEPRLFKGTGFGESLDDRGTKVGYKSMILEEELVVPEITLFNRIAFGVLCTLESAKCEETKAWAENWLNGTDRTIESANVACPWATATNDDEAAWAASAALVWSAMSPVDLDLIALAEKAMTIK